ncbi:hypothetical protein DXV76_18880 [Rhodobacteraceae bacterium CCMM004]|nr:hypothetical protein DXV76_18880 [Rhodobacteraceae bacterium CCMM004]
MVRRTFLLRGALAALLVALAAPVSAWAETRLVMVEEKGCIWCARWNADVGEEYPKTEEGRAAPLRRLDLRAPRPDDLSFAGPLIITPTFVLIRDGTEVSRLEGYPGEDFFWGLLRRMLGDAGVDLDAAG